MFYKGKFRRLNKASWPNVDQVICLSTTSTGGKYFNEIRMSTHCSCACRFEYQDLILQFLYTSILNIISKNTSCTWVFRNVFPGKKKKNGNSKQILIALGITTWNRIFKSSRLKIVNSIWCTTEQMRSGYEVPLKWRKPCNNIPSTILNYMALQFYQQSSDFLLLLVPLEEM